MCAKLDCATELLFLPQIYSPDTKAWHAHNTHW